MRALLAAAAVVAAGLGTASAASVRLCDRAPQATAQQQDRLLRFAAIVKAQLDESGATVAIMSRSGLDLRRFGIRYSHAGISLRASANAPWSVRQLYYACDESRPRVYDQGIAGYVLGLDDPGEGFISIVLLPAEAAAALERTALNNATALRMLAGAYSANAYPFSVRYQNCNQWLAELLAAAWALPGDLAVDATGNGAGDGQDARAHAQHWLAANGYDPAPVELHSHLLMFAAPFVPYVHLDDHPEQDRYALRLRVSLPAAIEAFVHARVSGARRIEICHDSSRVVVRHGWRPVEEGCKAGPDDAQIPFDDAPIQATGLIPET